LKDVPDHRSAVLMARLAHDAAGFLAGLGQLASSSSIDGLRYALASGEVIHYRPSGNAPELRCYVEAGTPERADAMLQWGLEAAAKVVR
ncbi:MAG: phosphomannomutase, partial [Devosia sp.]